MGFLNNYILVESASWGQDQDWGGKKMVLLLEFWFCASEALDIVVHIFRRKFEGAAYAVTKVTRVIFRFTLVWPWLLMRAPTLRLPNAE